MALHGRLFCADVVGSRPWWADLRSVRPNLVRLASDAGVGLGSGLAWLGHGVMVSCDSLLTAQARAILRCGRSRARSRGRVVSGGCPSPLSPSLVDIGWPGSLLAGWIPQEVTVSAPADT
jgi:hypothetical protein